MNDPPSWNEDFDAMVDALQAEQVDFVVVGAHALAAHGIARATGDFDLLVRASPEGADRVLRALARFGAPIAQHGVTREDFETPGAVYQIGLPPRRIDLLTAISGVDFERAWSTRTEVSLHGRTLPVLGYDALLENKRAAGRPKDVLDAQMLELMRAAPRT